MDRSQKRSALEDRARRRAVHGWAFRGLPEDEQDAIRDFLNGGPCPDKHKASYRLARKQLKLPEES